MQGVTLVLVTGSRSWTDRNRILEALIEAREATAIRDVMSVGPAKRMALMHGACPSGADQIAAQAAEWLGWMVLSRPADWGRYGASAGPQRNLAMVDEVRGYMGQGSRVVCLAFVLPCAKDTCPRRGAHWSHGAEHCGQAAEKAGIPTEWIEGA